MLIIKSLVRIACFLALTVVSAVALDLQGGKLKLVLYEKTGRFNVFHRFGEGAEGALPFLSERNIDSSFVTVVVGPKVFILGTSPGFSMRTEELPLGARFVWTSPQVEVIESFSFVSDSGIEIVLSAKNLTREDLLLGAGYFFDTYAGEKTRAPFLVDNRQVVARETVADTRTPVTWWFSGHPSAGRDAWEGFRVLVDGRSATAPDRIIFADWQRVYDRIWDLMRIGGREFSPQDSPLTDSAVYQNYDPLIIRAGQTRKVSVRIEGVVLPAPDAGAEGDGDDATLTAEKMNILNNLLEDVNRKIKAGEEFSPDDYSRIITLLEEISKNPEKEYEDMVVKVNILNNLLDVIDAMIDSGKYSREEINRLNEILKTLERSEEQ